MSDLDKLKDELKRVVEVADLYTISHTDVATNNGISVEYSRQIRKGNSPSKNIPENLKLVQGLIDGYRKGIRDKKAVLNAISVNI